MQERPATKGTSLRITEQDEDAIEAIIAAGWARNRSQAVSYALKIARAQLGEKATAV